MTIERFPWPRRERIEGGDCFNGAGAGGYFMGGSSSPLVSVQYGSIIIGAASGSNTVTITSVVTGNTVVMPLGATHSDVGTTVPEDAFGRLTLTNATTVTATRDENTVSVTIFFVVFELAGAGIKSKQAGTINYATTSNTATITAVVTTKAVLFPAGWSANVAIAARMFAAITLTNSTTITSSRADAGTGTINHAYQLLEFN